jgi:fibronectin type 3 domain-containing protein
MKPFPNGNKLLAAILALLALSTVGAQEGLTPGGIAGAATKDSILLRWMLPDDTYPAGGFVVTRTNGASSTRVALPSPLPREQALAAGLVTDGEYDFLAEVFAPGGTSSAGTAEEAELMRAIISLTTVVNPDYARVTGTLHEDTDVESGTTYLYTVETAAGLLLGSVEVTAGAVTDLAALTGLRAQMERGQVALRWRRPAEETLIATYNVYRIEDGQAIRINDDPVFLPIDEGDNQALFHDGAALVGRTYTYRVEGIDLFGRAAPLSAPVSIQVPDPRPLAAPQIENGVAGDKRITIEWSSPQDERVRALGVRRYTDPDGKAELLTPELLPASATSFTDDNVKGGINYYYALIAVDGAGRISQESILWAERGYNPTPPSAPARPAIIENSAGLTLSWQAPPEDDVSHYQVYVSRDASAAANEFRFTDATVGTTYELPLEQGNLTELHLVISAVNTSNVEGPASAVVSGRLIDTTPPPAPHLVDVLAGENRITVSWAATANPDVVALGLYRAQAEGEFTLLKDALSPASRHWVDHEVEPGVPYHYQLEALDASGNVSGRSARMTGRAFDLSQPGVVSDVRATFSADGVLVTWLQRPDLKYVVERARQAAAAPRFVEISDLLTAGSFADARGNEGDTYRVFAVDAKGRLGPASEPAAAR